MATVEQIRACNQQIQLCANQKAKTDILITQIGKNDGKQQMYRSIGRMFVACTGEELQEDLSNDIASIEKESERSKTMVSVLETKKEALTKQLNDLTPKEQLAK